MSHFSWEVEAMEQQQPEPQPELVKPLEFDLESMPEPPAPVLEPVADAGALAVSVDDFSALEERILRAVNLVKRERLARTEAEDRAKRLEANISELTPKIELLQSEVNTLRAERDNVRQRVERLLTQLDALEL